MSTEPDELLWRYVDGSLSVEEEAAFRSLLEARPELGRRVFALAEERLALREALLAPAVPAKKVSSRRLQPVQSKRSFSTRQNRRAGSRSSLGWGVSALLAACVALIAGITFWPKPVDSQPEAFATLQFVQGEWTLTRDGASLSATANLALSSGDTLSTSSTGSGSIVYPDGTRVQLQPDTSIRTNAVGGAKRVDLQRGELSASIAPQPKDKPMLFSTVNGVATVLGTELTLSETGNAAWLEVQKGKVQLARADGRTVDVSAGQFAVAGSGIDLEVREIATQPENVALKRPATASSFFQSIERGVPFASPAPQANDGDLETFWASRDNHIQPDPNAWWQVDLGLPCRVTRVELVSRQDKFNQAAARSNFEVRGSNSTDGSNYEVLARHGIPPFAHHGTWTGNVTLEKPFRYLRVVQLKADYSGFSEFRAFGRFDRPDRKKDK